MLKFTPRDIQKQEFKKIFRGYDPVEVDTFLEMVADEYDMLLRIRKELEEKVLKYETELKNYKEVEGTLQETLLEAKRTSVASLESSKKEAAVVISDAEVRAKAILEEAQRTVRKFQDDIAALRTQKESIIRQLKQLLQSQLDYVRTFESSKAAGVPEELKPESVFESAQDKEAVELTTESVPARPAPQPMRQTVPPKPAGAPAEKKSSAEGIPPGAQKPQPAPQKPLSAPKPTPPAGQRLPDQQAKDSSSKTMIRNGFDLIDKLLDEEEQKSEE